MVEDKTNCSACGRQVRTLTAERKKGMCAPCYRNSDKPPEELFAEEVFARIETTISPFTTYKAACKELSQLPRGYTLCFAFQTIHSELFNGGVSQLHSNSTWSLIVDAQIAAQQAGDSKVALLLREIIFYYHRQGRSKLKRKTGDEYFSDIPETWNKSLKQLDDEFYQLEDMVNQVVLTLCRDHQALFKSVT